MKHSKNYNRLYIIVSSSVFDNSCSFSFSASVLSSTNSLSLNNIFIVGIEAISWKTADIIPMSICEITNCNSSIERIAFTPLEI